MPTLRELIDKYGMGKRYRCETWLDGEAWFEPKIITPNKKEVIGFNQDGAGLLRTLEDYNEWSLYEEPKKKVTRWLWVAKLLKGQKTPYLTASDWVIYQNFLSEEEANCISILKDAEKMKLEWSRTEFES